MPTIEVKAIPGYKVWVLDIDADPDGPTWKVVKGVVVEYTLSFYPDHELYKVERNGEVIAYFCPENIHFTKADAQAVADRRNEVTEP